MAKKEPLFEGSVSELLAEWHSTQQGKHWMDKGSRRIVIHAQPKAWEQLIEQNGDKAVSRS